MSHSERVFFTCLLCVLMSACGGSSETKSLDNISSTAPSLECGPFSDWRQSPFLLPYPVGTQYVVNQANCSGFGHGGFWTYGYDFIMDIGTGVTAMRDGTVFHLEDGTPDGNRLSTNLIIIQHSDGSFALYSHLTNGGVLVAQEQNVVAGDLIGLSGDTGNTGGLPHLHVSLHPCGGLPGLAGVANTNCPTRPFNFANTEPNPQGLSARVSYLAHSVP